MGDFWRDERCDHAGELRIDVGERLGAAEPDDHHDLHADRNQQRRIGDVHGDCDGDAAEPSGDRVIHSESRKHCIGRDQHAELGDDGRGDHYHHSRDIYVGFCERHHEREPEATTTYVLTATNAAGSATATAMVTVAAAGGTLQDHHDKLPGWNAGNGLCRLHHRGQRRDAALYVFGRRQRQLSPAARRDGAGWANGNDHEPSHWRAGDVYARDCGDGLNRRAGHGQTSASPSAEATRSSANIFPSDSIFHHRVDAATTGLPVDTSPAAAIYSGYLSSTIKPFFGGAAYANFPNGIPAIEVPWNQPDVAVSTTVYQSYFTFGPDPCVCAGGRHKQLVG